MRAIAVLSLLGVGCAYDPLDSGDDDEVPQIAIEPVVSIDAPREPVGAPGQWRFAVLSDLHLPNPRAAVIDREVAALIELGVRFVVITGDHTNGAAIVDHRNRRVGTWWSAVTAALEPLRDAGIAVLPIAGNHDTYLPWQRDGYASAFADLATWAAPLEVHPATGRGFARAPFSYSVDVDGLHLALAHIVDQTVDRDVAAWLAEDLAGASEAGARIVFGHVPMVSVVARPAHRFGEQLGGILARGNAEMYVAGHEHLAWDETFEVAGASLRQVTVGCASGFYVFAPSKAARARACDGARCTMPNGGKFELVRDRSGRMIEHDAATFALFTVTGDDVQATPMTVDEAGRAHAFYLMAE